MNSQTNASESALRQAEAEAAQAEAQAAAAASTYARLQEAAKTPGAVAGNELVQAEKQKEAAESLVQSRKAAVRTAKDRLQATKDMQSYLYVTAPFDGTIADRWRTYAAAQASADGTFPAYCSRPRNLHRLDFTEKIHNVPMRLLIPARTIQKKIAGSDPLLPCS
jgi:multidrug efflux pump subunit AcrA (membrane-fusion protein)